MSGIASWLLGGFVSLAGLFGLIAASRARDPGIYLFGLALFAFAVLFVFGLIRRCYDERERAAAEEDEKSERRAA